MRSVYEPNEPASYEFAQILYVPARGSVTTISESVSPKRRSRRHRGV